MPRIGPDAQSDRKYVCAAGRQEDARTGIKGATLNRCAV